MMVFSVILVLSALNLECMPLAAWNIQYEVLLRLSSVPYFSYCSVHSMLFMGLQSLSRTLHPAAPDFPSVPPKTRSSRLMSQLFWCSAWSVTASRNGGEPYPIVHGGRNLVDRRL